MHTGLSKGWNSQGYLGAVLWNELPNDIRTAKSKAKALIKSKLKHIYNDL